MSLPSRPPGSRFSSIRKSLRLALRPDANAMVLRQTHLWSRAILWTIIGVTVATILWACLAPMDEVIHATGKLQPRGSVQDVQSPVSGVIQELLVQEGETVKTGAPLVRLDPKVATAEVASLRDQLAAMRAEEDFYARLFQSAGMPVAPVGLPSGVADLAKDHAALRAEDKLLRAILDASTDGANLNLDQRQLYTTELKDRVENYERIRSQLEQAGLIEANNKKIYEAFSKLVDSGATSRVDLLARESTWLESVARVKNLESQRENIITTFKKEAMTSLSANTKRLAEIESNLTKARLANSQRILETGSRLEAAREALDYHLIKSPSNGIVFEIVSSKPGAVIGAKDIVLKIVPSEELIAKVDISNTDIGFVNTGMPCEIEVDTFPKREFGYIHGEVYFVGSDVLPPTEVKPFYSFPAKISLHKQNLTVRNKDIPLQSGMSINVNIKIRKRVVINIFLDNLLGPVERMKELR